MMDGYYWSGGGWNGFDFFFSLLVTVFWILLIVWVVRTVVQSRHWKQGGEQRQPLDIAQERYAKGEISKQELAEIRKELQK